ncbi:flagellar protein FliT [Dyella japonica]|nr:flagellar protein FliT [Dyella japonica]
MSMDNATHTVVLQLSERMLAAAREGDWNAVATLESERSDEIARLPMTESQSLPVLKTLLAHTEEVRELARQQRDRLDDDLGQHQHRHRALSAYLRAGVE